MHDGTPIEELPTKEVIELSSFGSDEARGHRRRTPPSASYELLVSLRALLGGDPTGGPAPTSTTMMPFVFLSYAREGDGEGPSEQSDVRRFFRQLCTHLIELVPVITFDERTPSTIVVPGYLAGEPWTGREDQSGTLSALASCRIFVPLVSERYFRDGLCRAEWTSFERRDEVLRAHHPLSLSAIVPVQWEPVSEADVPEWASGHLITDPTPGLAGEGRSLRALMAENSPAYPNAAYRIARHIQQVAESRADAPPLP
jgi:hypothetical protein